MKADRRITPRATVLAGLLIYGLLMLGACAVSRNASPPTGSPTGTSTGTPTGSPTGTGGTTATPSGTVAAAKLACAIRHEPVTADTVSTTLSCTVTGSASDQTSFEATYTMATTGAKGGPEASCRGALRNGSGSCAVTFDQNALSSRLGTVTAELLPSQRRLGPVTPTQTS